MPTSVVEKLFVWSTKVLCTSALYNIKLDRLKLFYTFSSFKQWPYIPIHINIIQTSKIVTKNLAAILGLNI